jgi:quinol monooxygenase YgiN
MTRVNLVVELQVKAEEAERFVAMFRQEFVGRSKAEQGCLLYDLWVDPQHHNRMVIVESWASRSDLDRHLAQDWFSQWAPRMEAAQETPLVVRTFTDA